MIVHVTVMCTVYAWSVHIASVLLILCNTTTITYTCTKQSRMVNDHTYVTYLNGSCMAMIHNEARSLQYSSKLLTSARKSMWYFYVRICITTKPSYCIKRKVSKVNNFGHHIIILVCF